MLAPECSAHREQVSQEEDGPRYSKPCRLLEDSKGNRRALGFDSKVMARDWQVCHRWRTRLISFSRYVNFKIFKLLGYLIKMSIDEMTQP